MKMKCWPLVVLLAMMAGACSDDDADVTMDNDPEVPEEPETTPEGKKLMFTVTGSVIASSGSAWLLVSDQQGNVLETAELKNNETHTFEAAEGFTDESVTLTLIRNYAPAYTSIETYAQVPFGQYGLTGTSTTGTVVGKTTVTLADYAGEWYSITTSGPTVPSTRPDQFEHTDAGAKFTITTRAAKSKVLLVKTEAPFEYLYTDFEQNKEYTVQPGDFVSAEGLDFPVPDAEYAGWEITGINSDGQFRYLSWGVERPPFDPPTVRTIPIIPNLFTSYLVTLTSRNGNASELYMYKGRDMPTTMKHMDGTLTYYGGENTFSWETTGVADAVRLQVIAVGNGNNRADWSLYGAAGNQQFSLPAIPDNVPLLAENVNAVRSFGSLGYAYGLTTELWEYPEYTSYQDVVVKRYLVPGTLFPWTDFLSKRETFDAIE